MAMWQRIVAVVLATLLTADAITLKSTKIMLQNPNEALNMKSKKKAIVDVKQKIVEAEEGRIQLEMDETMSPKLEGHMATEGNSVQQILRSDEGMAYYGEIRVGGQIQQGIYDTGSFDLVVLSTCTKNQVSFNKIKHEPQCCPRTKCPKANYNSLLSGNWVRNAEEGTEKITYGSGPVFVTHGSDHVEFRSSDGQRSISDVDVPTKVIVDHNIDLFLQTDLQAIVGLGPGKFEEVEQRMPHHLGVKRYLICFHQDPRQDGVITWNDNDRSNDPAYVSVPVMGKLFWATKITSFRLTSSSRDGKPLGNFFKEPHLSDILPFASKNEHVDGPTGPLKACDPSCGAIIDTGTSLLTPPKEVIDQISAMLDAGHIKDCSDMSKFPTLTFALGDKEFSLPPEAYIGFAEDEQVGFKHASLAFPLLPLRSQLSTAKHNLALKQDTNISVGPVNLKEEFPRAGACAIMMAEGDPDDPTPWGPMVIFGMGLFRKYAIQFDVAGDIDGIQPSLSHPTRIMRFTEASPDCSKDAGGKAFNLKQKRTLEGSKLRKLNLKKIRKSTFQRHLDASRTNKEYTVAGYKFRHKGMLRI